MQARVRLLNFEIFEVSVVDVNVGYGLYHVIAERAPFETESKGVQRSFALLLAFPLESSKLLLQVDSNWRSLLEATYAFVGFGASFVR